MGKSRHSRAERLEVIRRDHEKLLRDHAHPFESEKLVKEAGFHPDRHVQG